MTTSKITSDAPPDAHTTDAEAFKALVSGCYGRMFALATRLTGCRADGEDVVQDVLTRLWQQRDNLAGIKSLEAYVTGMTRNAAIDFIRRRRPTVSIEDEPSYTDTMSAPSGEALLLRREEMEVIMLSIGRLSENQRTVITLRDVEGRELEEIERITGLSAVNVRVLLSRGRKSLRAMIEKRMRSDLGS